MKRRCVVGNVFLAILLSSPIGMNLGHSFKQTHSLYDFYNKQAILHIQCLLQNTKQPLSI